MALIPKNNPLDVLNDKGIVNMPRAYLGLSQVGHSCHRFLQHYHYWTFTSYIDARIQRLFNVGHDAEDSMIADLARVGITVDVNSQQESIVGVAGHWKGHTDGTGVWGTDEFLLEFKTHNDKSFKLLKKDKVKKSKPVHYSQMQAYMGYTGLTKGLYMALNKNDSTYYFEWVDYDPEHFKDLKRKQVEVITSDVLLPRIGNNSPAWFECRFCDANKVCFGKKEVVKSCRSCAFVDVLPEGKWACTNKARQSNVFELSNAKQLLACDDYELADMFKEVD